MKPMYWRPRKVSVLARVLVAAAAMGGVVVAESFFVEVRQPHYREKLEAARLARSAMDIIRAERLSRGITLDDTTDPTGSGLVGPLITPITTGSGSLTSKRTSVNPNFAAVMVQYFKRLELNEGDVVAVGLSGSFPALNICTFAALQTLKLRPVVVTSAAASQFGANHPKLTWVDMERVLHERGVFTARSVAVSPGGIGDQGLGLSEEGRNMLLRIIDKSGLPHILPETNEASMKQRMSLYVEGAGGDPIKAYVNVGGGTVSVGTRVGKKNIQPGINRRLPRALEEIPSVMGQFLAQGVPVIHMGNVLVIAERFGLPLDPITLPSVGQGAVFVRREYNRFLALGCLGLLLLTVTLVFRGRRLSAGAMTLPPA